MDNGEILLSKRRHVELASQRLEGLPTLRKVRLIAFPLRPITQSWASFSVLRAHSPEADLPSYDVEPYQGLLQKALPHGNL